MNVAAVADVLPYAGCDVPGAIRENYCFPALETGVIEGKGIYAHIPKSELRPRPIKSFRFLVSSNKASTA